MNKLGLYEIMRAQGADLVTSVERGLETAGGTPHYRELDHDVLNERIESLVEHFLRSMHGDPVPFVEFLREISETRIAEGFRLREVQTALTMLEQRASRIVAMSFCEPRS